MQRPDLPGAELPDGVMHPEGGIPVMGVIWRSTKSLLIHAKNQFSISVYKSPFPFPLTMQYYPKTDLNDMQNQNTMQRGLDKDGIIVVCCSSFNRWFFKVHE